MGENTIETIKPGPQLVERPIITLLCGTICAGKTTFAKEQFSNLPGTHVFSQDELLIDLYPKEIAPREVFDDRWSRIQLTTFKISKSLIRSGLNIVFDYGFHTEKQRLEYINYAKSLNCKVALIYFKTCAKTLEHRRLERNNNLDQYTFYFERDFFESLVEEFEEPNNFDCYDEVSIIES